MSNSPKALYQYVGKDDTYELLGDCIGAGTNRGNDTVVYRNIHDGRMFSRFPDDFANRLQRIGEMVVFQHDDTDLLREALDLLEYVTYHDGRYGQQTYSKFQGPAQQLVVRLAERLGVKPYESQKQG